MSQFLKGLTEHPMASELSLTLLGGLTLTLDNQPVSLSSRKARALLCYLAVTRRAHSRSALAGLFWSDVSEAKARMNLRKDLSRLRQKFGDYLIIDRDSVAFDVGAFDSDTTACAAVDADIQAWVDVNAFDGLLDSAQQDHSPMDALTNAVALYQGDFLEGFYVLNAPLFEEWILLRRGRLREQVLGALQTITALYLQQELPNKAIETLRQLLALEPWLEEAHHQLMDVLAQIGQRAAALAQYDLCERVLAEELGVEPSAGTQGLYVQIREGVYGAIAPKPAAFSEMQPEPTAQPISAKHNLPAQTIPFVGRQQELTKLQHLLTQPNSRLVSILGPGGVGKTRLAQEVAATLMGDYPDGVYFVPLAPLSDPEPMVSTIAASVGFAFETDEGPQQAQLLDYLRSKKLLLILDNVEHLLDGVDLFTAILEGSPQLRLVVTSRERLRLMSETVFALDGLAVSDELCDASADAIALFVQIGQRVCPDFVPSEADWPSMRHICQLVGGMPLGLILAASWLELLSVSKIAAEIDQSLAFLAADLRDLPERQRSLQAVFDTTWRRLSVAEQDAFKKLAVFQGGFTSDAAQSVADASFSTLSALSQKSLIRHNGNGRYEIHELLRQFALTALADLVAETRDAHSTYYCGFMQQRESDLKDAHQQSAILEIEAESENVRSAWQWAASGGHVDTLLQSVEGLGLYYLWQSRFEEGAAMCQQALTNSEIEKTMFVLLKTREADGDAHCHHRFQQVEQSRCRIRVAVWLSRFQRHLGQHDSAKQVLQEAQDWLPQASIDGSEPHAEQARLQLEEAEVVAVCEREWLIELIEESRSRFRMINDNWHAAQGLDLLGKGLRETGKLEDSKRAIEEGLALRQQLGDERGIASSLANLANTVANMGRFEVAASLYRESIALFAQLNDRGQQAYQVFRLAAALVHGGQFNESFQLLDESTNIHRDLALPNELGEVTILTGFALMHLGRYEDALPFHLKARTLSGRNTGYAWKDLGRTEQAMGHVEDAQACLEKSVELFQKRGDMNGLGQSSGCLGFLALRRHNLPEAQAHIYKNLEIAANTQVFLPSLTALSGVALLEVEAGNAEVAIELYTLALQHKHVANSRWFQDVVGQHISQAAETVSPELVAAAQARGRELELADTVSALWAETSARSKLCIG